MEEEIKFVSETQLSDGSYDLVYEISIDMYEKLVDKYGKTDFYEEISKDVNDYLLSICKGEDYENKRSNN